MDEKVAGALKRERRRKSRLRVANRQIIRAEKSRRGCELCARRDLPPADLHFHHRDQSRKRRKISHMIWSATETLVEEIAQCRLWCKWSHRKYHETGAIRPCKFAFTALPNAKEADDAA